jgi:hypothetical protein
MFCKALERLQKCLGVLKQVLFNQMGHLGTTKPIVDNDSCRRRFQNLKGNGALPAQGVVAVFCQDAESMWRLVDQYGEGFLELFPHGCVFQAKPGQTTWRAITQRFNGLKPGRPLRQQVVITVKVCNPALGQCDVNLVGDEQLDSRLCRERGCLGCSVKGHSRDYNPSNSGAYFATPEMRFSAPARTLAGLNARASNPTPGAETPEAPPWVPAPRP